MASASSGLDALAQREALLLRLNDEIDADARATISDTERYLQGPLPAPPPPFHPSHTDTQSAAWSAPNQRSGGRSARRAVDVGLPSGLQNNFSGNAEAQGTERRCTGVGVMAATKDDEYVCRNRLDVDFHGGNNGRVGGSGSGASLKTDLTPAPTTGSSPLFRLSERVKEAARASGERNRRKTAASSTLAEDPIHLAGNRQRPSSRMREGRSLRGQGDTQFRRPNSVESGEGGDEGDAQAQGRSGVAVGNVPVGIGEEATARFLKAKLSACQSQFEEAQATQQSSQAEAMELRKQAALEQEHARRLSRQLQQLQQASEKTTKAKNDEAASSATLSAKVLELERELGGARKAARQSDTEKKSLEVRLHRALEEVSKQKEAVRQARGQTKDVGQGQRFEIARLEVQCQRLERQKMELLSAFKKQLKLIDVLKRQKFHVEAARLLAFTEEDFVKTLDWAS